MRSIIHSEDGSPTIYDSRFQEHYHSIHGARTESEHIYIQSGLAFLSPQKECAIFEMGLGTALNVLLTAEYAKKNPDINFKYYALEAFPLSELEYKSLIPSKQELWLAIHEAKWEQWFKLLPNFQLIKIQEKFDNFLPHIKVDLIYYDAFSPKKQPELWSLDACNRIKMLCKPATLLVTYSAQVQFRRNLESIGFQAEKIPGPLGKKEIIRAIFTS